MRHSRDVPVEVTTTLAFVVINQRTAELTVFDDFETAAGYAFANIPARVVKTQRLTITAGEHRDPFTEEASE